MHCKNTCCRNVFENRSNDEDLEFGSGEEHLNARNEHRRSSCAHGPETARQGAGFHVCFCFCFQTKVRMEDRYEGPIGPALWWTSTGLTTVTHKEQNVVRGIMVQNCRASIVEVKLRLVSHNFSQLVLAPFYCAGDLKCIGIESGHASIRT